MCVHTSHFTKPQLTSTSEFADVFNPTLQLISRDHSTPLTTVQDKPSRQKRQKGQFVIQSPFFNINYQILCTTSTSSTRGSLCDCRVTQRAVLILSLIYHSSIDVFVSLVTQLIFSLPFPFSFSFSLLTKKKKKMVHRMDTVEEFPAQGKLCKRKVKVKVKAEFDDSASDGTHGPFLSKRPKFDFVGFFFFFF